MQLRNLSHVEVGLKLDTRNTSNASWLRFDESDTSLHWAMLREGAGGELKATVTLAYIGDEIPEDDELSVVTVTTDTWYERDPDTGALAHGETNEVGVSASGRIADDDAPSEQTPRVTALHDPAEPVGSGPKMRGGLPGDGETGADGGTAVPTLSISTSTLSL